MNWDNLLDNKCPKCGEFLQENPDTLLWECEDVKDDFCDFTISDRRKRDVEFSLRNGL